tara:strand:+ start:25 stop:819 length:795 start_codon:yes stop_codon:yes gene_type:complete
MAQQTFAGVPAEFTAGEVLSSSDQNLLRNFLIAQIKEGMTGDTGEILPMIMDLTNNRIVLDAGGLEFSNGSLQTVAAAAGLTWSGSTANGLGTYGSSSSIVSESTATYDGTTLQLTTSGGGLKLDNLAPSEANTLGDYEIGTCTIGITPGSGSITVGTPTAGYTKIGRMVTVSARVLVSAISTPSGHTKITGLPFIVKNDLTYEPCGSAYLFGQASGAGGLSLTAGKNGTEAYCYMTDGTLPLQGGAIDANTEFQFTITYATTA